MSEITKQKTLAQDVEIKGVGLHTGRKCKIVCKPAGVNEGIRFIRTDVSEKPVFEVHVKNVVDVIRGTTLGQGEYKVYTIEHVLSAVNALEIDNLTIEIDDIEPPVCDGSAKEFWESLFKAGVVEQEAPKNFFTVDKTVEYTANETLIRIEPSDSLEIDCEVHYDHPLIKTQTFQFKRADLYQNEIAPARTYCFDYEIEALKKKGLAKGGSLDNAIVVGPTGVYNPGNFLRFQDEFVRHKLLDLMGDLMLIGFPLKGKITAKRPGHGHNVNFLKQLLSECPAPTSVASV